MFLQKLSFTAQAFWFRLVMLASFIMLLLVFIYVGLYSLAPADSKKTHAPFAEDIGSTAPGEITLPLDQPNRSYLDMENWISVVISEALTFDAETYGEKLSSMREQYFQPDAYAEYKLSLENAGVPGVLRNRDMRTSIFLEERPALVNEGVINGKYRWLYEVPVTISYLPRLQKSYRAGQAPQNVRVRIRLQAGRLKDPEDPLAVTYAFATRNHPEQGVWYFPDSPYFGVGTEAYHVMGDYTGRVGIAGDKLGETTQGSGIAIYSCLGSEENVEQPRPGILTFRRHWPKDIQDKVMANWDKWGFRAPDRSQKHATPMTQWVYFNSTGEDETDKGV